MMYQSAGDRTIDKRRGQWQIRATEFIFGSFLLTVGGFG
jgi:hypothetical protein